MSSRAHSVHRTQINGIETVGSSISPTPLPIQLRSHVVSALWGGKKAPDNSAERTSQAESAVVPGSSPLTNTADACVGGGGYPLIPK